MRPILCLYFTAALWANDGRTPPSSAAEYPAHQDVAGGTIAAVRVAPEVLNRIFPSDLSKKYVVVEVAIYPKDGAAMEVAARDFTLRLTDSESHPETAEEVAAMWRPHSNAHPDITNKTHVNTETGVVVAHGTDPVTGRPVTRAGTYERVGVSGGDDPRYGGPYPTGGSNNGVDADRFEAMLGNWALPEGKAGSAVAGYLYFLLPKATKGKGKAFELQYSHEGSSGSLTLPALSK